MGIEPAQAHEKPFALQRANSYTRITRNAGFCRFAHTVTVPAPVSSRANIYMRFCSVQVDKLCLVVACRDRRQRDLDSMACNQTKCE